MTEKQLASGAKPWGLTIDEFFYFFMGLRKGEIRKQVRTLQERYPDESPHQLARRCITAQWPLSLMGGALLHVPALFPVLGPATKALGVATGASVMIRLNMTMLLQIALLYGYDIDSRARLKEMVAIIVASGLNSSSSMFTHLLDLNRYYKALMGGATVMSANQVIGEAALLYYSRGRHAGRL
jgi:hypothetical protein